MIRRGLFIAIVAVIAAARVTSAQTNGHGPDSWHVTGIAADDVLNVRMRPGTDYPVIEKFAADARGLEQLTCVPFYALRHLKKMTDAQVQALPAPWCLMRDANMERAGWVAQRFITADDAAPALPETSGQSRKGDPLGRLSARFLEGYQSRETLQVLGQILSTLESESSQSSPFLPSHRIRPLTMAVLALEAADWL